MIIDLQMASIFIWVIIWILGAQWNSPWQLAPQLKVSTRLWRIRWLKLFGYAQFSSNWVSQLYAQLTCGVTMLAPSICLQIQNFMPVQSILSLIFILFMNLWLLVSSLFGLSTLKIKILMTKPLCLCQFQYFCDKLRLSSMTKEQGRLGMNWGPRWDKNWRP